MMVHVYMCSSFFLLCLEADEVLTLTTEKTDHTKETIVVSLIFNSNIIIAASLLMVIVYSLCTQLWTILSRSISVEVGGGGGG